MHAALTSVMRGKNILVGFVLVLVAGCAGSQPTARAKRVEVAQLQQQIRQLESPGH
jgi:hypothetical protein